MTVYSLDVFLPNFDPVCCSMSAPSCCVLTCRFPRKQVRWFGIPISLRFFHSLLWSVQSKGFSVVSETEVDVFLELSFFFYDPTDVSNLISGSSAFSKSSLNIWKFSIQILLKLCLENFEHYFASMWDECNCVVVWTFFGLAFLWDWNENCEWKLTFSSPLATAECSKFAGILSVVLSQHHLLGFETVQLEFYHLH